MSIPTQPHPLTPAQRIGVRSLRLVMAASTRLMGLRGRSETGPIEALRYGTRRNETLQLIHPAGDHGGDKDAVVYIHGGGWICGQKEFYTHDLAFLSQRGHTLFKLDYPLAPEHPHPLPLCALIRALAWIVRRHPSASRIHLMGDSAGGNLAVMLGYLLTDRRLLRSLDPDLGELCLPSVASVISLYGVLDRLSWLEAGFPSAALMLHSYAGRAAFESEVGPELAITPLDLAPESRPPAFLAAGSKDPLLESSRLASRRMSEPTTPDANTNGPLVVFKEYSGEQHGFFNMGWRENSTLLKNDILSFIASVESGEESGAQDPARDQT